MPTRERSQRPSDDLEPRRRDLDDGVWELTLGALLALLALTLATGRLPVFLIVLVPCAAALVRWTLVRPRLGPSGWRQQLATLRLGPMGLLCLLVVVAAVIVGAMARDGREAFEPARSAVPGIAAAATLALAALSALLGARLGAPRFGVWSGFAVVGLLLEPLAEPRARTAILGLLGLVTVVAGAWRLWRFLRHSTAGRSEPRNV